VGRQVQRAYHPLCERALLAKNEALILRQCKVRTAIRVCAQPRTVGLVGSQGLKADQAPGLVVAAFMRQKVAQQMAAAAVNDMAPAARVVGNRLALKGIDVVENEACDDGVQERLVDKGFTISG